jgi:hypothetical protein
MLFKITIICIKQIVVGFNELCENSLVSQRPIMLAAWAKSLSFSVSALEVFLLQI